MLLRLFRGGYVKIKIAYAPGERLIAERVVETLVKLLPNGRVRTSQKNPPFTHVYMETPRPKTE